MSIQEKQKLINYLQKTGYPLELKVARELVSLGWSQKKYYYRDIDEDKLREIDILAVRPCKIELGENRGHTFFRFILIVECKKQDKGKPWVFLTSETLGLDEIAYLKSTYFSFPNIDFSVIDALISKLATLGLHHFSINSKVADSWTIAHDDDGTGKRKDTITDPIFKSIMSVKKCTDSLISGSFKSWIWNVYQPLVVLDGKMWNAYLSNSSDIEIEEVDKIRLNWRSEDYGQVGFRYIDIVRFDKLREYLHGLKVTIDNMHSELQEILKEKTTLTGIRD